MLETDLLGATTSPAPGLFGDVTITQTGVVGAIEDSKENTAIEQKVEDPSANGGANSSGFSFIGGGAGSTDDPSAPNSPSKATFDPLLSPETRNVDPNSMMNMQQQMQMPAQMNPQMAAAYQQQILMMQMQMQQMQMAPAQFMMMQQAVKQQNSGGITKMPSSSMINVMPGGNKVMGATTGSGVATSFAFMDDPTKVKQDASNKKFDFVQDAMKDAK